MYLEERSEHHRIGATRWDQTCLPDFHSERCKSDMLQQTCQISDQGLGVLPEITRIVVTYLTFSLDGKSVLSIPNQTEDAIPQTCHARLKSTNSPLLSIKSLV
eukprot:4261375-Amphidinium_carterae.1